MRVVAFIADEFKLTIEQAGQQQVGFSDRRLGKNLPTTDSQLGRDLRELLKAFGLYKETGHETLRGCITFSLFDENDTITGIEGRRIDKHGKGPQDGIINASKVHTPLSSATCSGHYEVAQLLCKHGATADVSGGKGDVSVLQNAIARRSRSKENKQTESEKFEAFVEANNLEQVAEILKERPWLARAPRKALHIASANGNLAMARLLLHHGADPNQD